MTRYISRVFERKATINRGSSNASISGILRISKSVFKEVFSKEPEIKAIHAGHECGILESKNPGIDMISFGPTIMGAHSPDERIKIDTVERFYDLLKGILKRIAMQN